MRSRRPAPTQRFKPLRTPEGKSCSCCREFKPWANFYRSKMRVDGRTMYCKPCLKIKSQAKRLRPQKRFSVYRTATEKSCSKCRIIKAKTEFYKGTTADGFMGYCKQCFTPLSDQRKRFILYGITAEQYEKFLDTQKGVCKICKMLPERGLCVDHDHATGKVRGLLCHDCNLGLGRFKDKVAILREAINYLQEN